MPVHLPVRTILCVQCSRHAQVRQGALLPAGWAEHSGQYSCSDECRDLMRSMGLILEE